MESTSVINKTGKAVVAISLIVFCLSCIVWLIAYGVPTNTLHQSALSWSYTVLLCGAASLGLDTAISSILSKSTAGLIKS